jgi:tetratricopeptide (TPR) repeat protein
LSVWGKIFGHEKRDQDYQRGIKYYNEGKYEQAVEELEKVVADVDRSNPSYALGMFYAAESHVHLGNAKFYSGDYQGALEHFMRALEENPTYPDIYYRIGVIYHRLDKTEKAEEYLDKAIKLNDRYFEAICYRGMIFYEKGEKEKAQSLFQKALSISREMPTPISKYLSTHLDSRKTDIPPLKELKQVISTDSDFNIYVKNGVSAFNTSDYDRAIESFYKARDLHPEYADIRFKLGLSYMKTEQYGEAGKELKRALEINENYTEARFYLGIVYLDEGMYRRALEHFERASREKPEYADVLCYLGATYFYLGEKSKAKKALEKSLRISPGYRSAKNYYGLLLYSMGDDEKAVEHLSSAIAGEEMNESTSMSLALMYMRKGDLEEAMGILHGILESGGESADLLYFLGEVNFGLKRLEEAEEFYRRSLQKNPDFLRAREKLAYILVKRGDYDSAEELISSNSDNFADIYKIMGDIKFFKNDLDLAEKYYRKSLDVNAEYGEAMESLVLVLRKNGREEEADQLLNRLLEIDPQNVVARNLISRGHLDLDSD